MRVPTGRLWVVEDPEPPPSGAVAGPPSPGHYIRDQRLRRGMSLEEIAEKTKIPRASLEALEEERWSALPGPVFVKGFLRCCARALEIDDQVVVDLLLEQERAQIHAQTHAEAAPPAELPRPRRGRPPSELAYGAGAEGSESSYAPQGSERSEGPEGPESATGFEALGGQAMREPGARQELVERQASDDPRTRTQAGLGSARPRPWSPPGAGGVRAAPRPGVAARLADVARGLGGSPLGSRIGDIFARIPAVSLLLWIAVVVLVLGLVFAVLLAASNAPLMSPES